MIARAGILWPRTGSAREHRGDCHVAAVKVLAWNVFIPQDRMTVTVHNGWITWVGTFEWHDQKAAAEHAVHSLLGVRGVTNLIMVKPTVLPTAVKA